MHIDTLFTSAGYIVSEKPISVAQYNKSGFCNTSGLGDPCMVIIPPVNLLKTRAIFQCDDGIQGTATPNHFINIVVNAGTGTPASLDGLPLSGFQTLSYNPQYLYKQVTTTSGVHNLYAPNGFNAFTYGLGSYNAYAYHLGFDFMATVTATNGLEGYLNTTLQPNPFSETTTLQITNAKVLNESLLEVFSVEGKLVFSKTFNGNSVTIERKNIDAGIYFYTVKNSGDTIAKGKVVVQ